MKYLILFLLIIPLTIYSSPQAGTTSGDILLMPASANALAMGEAFSYIKDNVNSMLYNPSSLSRLKTVQMSVLYQKYIADINYDTINIGIPLYGGGLGISFKAFLYPDIYENVVEGGSIIAKTKLGNINDLVFTMGFGKRVWDNLDAGINVKYYYSSLVDYSGSAFLADVGITYSLRAYMIPSGDFHFTKEIKAYKDLEIHYTRKKYNTQIKSLQSEIEKEIKEINEQLKEIESRIKSGKQKKEQVSLNKQIEYLKKSKESLKNISVKKTENMEKMKDQEIRKLNRYYNIVLEDFHTEQKLRQLSNEGEKLQFLRKVRLRKSERYFNELINKYNYQLITMENEINEEISERNIKIEELKNEIKSLQEQKDSIVPVPEKIDKNSGKKEEKKKKDSVKDKTPVKTDKKPVKSQELQLSSKQKEEIKELENEIKEKENTEKELKKQNIMLRGKLSREIKKIEKMISGQKLLSESEKRKIDEKFKKSLKDEKIKNQVRLDIEQKYEIKNLKDIDQLSKTINDKIEKLTTEREQTIFKKDQSISLLKVKRDNLKNSPTPDETQIKQIENEIKKLEETYNNQLTMIIEDLRKYQKNIDYQQKIVLVNNFNDLIKELVDSDVAKSEESSLYYQKKKEIMKLNNQYSKILAQIEVNKKLSKKNPVGLLKKEKEYNNKLISIKEKYYNYITSKKYKESEADIVKLRESTLKKLREELKVKLQDMDDTISTKDEDIYLEKIKFEKEKTIEIINLKYADKIKELKKQLSNKNLKPEDKEKLQKKLKQLIAKQDKELEESTEEFTDKINNYNRDILRKGNNIFFTFSVLNLGTKIKYDSEETSLPLTARFGVGTYILDNLNFGIEASREIIEERNIINVGTEYKLLNLFPVRAGYQIGKDDGGLTLGTGVDTVIRLGLTRFNISLNYTYIPSPTFSDVHTIGVTIKKL